MLVTIPGFNRWRWTCFAVGVALAVLLFWPAMQFCAFLFRDPQEDLSHGWLIPLVSAYAIWQGRAALRAAAGAPDARGLAAIFGCLALFWLGSRGEQARLMQLGMIGAVVAIPLALWGARVARRLLFPAAYLLFILPTSFMDVLTFRLRLLASWLATTLLNGVGLSVQQVGTAMVSTSGAGFQLDVADPCSGMRSIFALAALTAAYAYFTQRTGWRRWLLFACAVPIAIAGNIARIVSIALVAHWMGQKHAVGFYHEYSGYVVFAVAVLLMVQAGAWIARLGKAPPGESAAAAKAPAAAVSRLPGGWRAPGVCALVPVLLAAGWLLLLRVPTPVMEADDFMALAQPARVDGFAGSTPLYCQNDQCLQVVDAESLPAGAPRVCPRCGGPLFPISLGEKNILPSDTRLLKRVYRDGAGEMLAATVVVSGASRLSIHRPEMCLPGQGFHILSNQKRTLDLGHGVHLQVRAVQAARTGEAPIGFIYWFVNPRTETASHWVRIFSDVWTRSAHNRINRWSMITLFGNRPLDQPETLRAVERFLAEWYPQMLRKEGAPKE